MRSIILDRFVQKVAQIIQTEGAACFSLGVADNRLHPQAVISRRDGITRDSLGHVDVDSGGAFSAAVSTALSQRGPVVIDEATRIDDFKVNPPVLVMPIIWEREPLESEEEPVQRAVGVLALWEKRGGRYDEDDYKLAETLSGQAAALLVEEQLDEFDDIQAAFSTVPVGLMLVAPDNSVLVANAAAMLVTGVDPLQGRRIENIDYGNQLTDLLKQARDSNDGNSALAYVSRDNESYSASAQLTQEKQAIVAFTQSPFSTAAEELTGQVAHELRTPLTVIQGNLQTIEVMIEGGIHPEDQDIIQEFISTALIQSSRMFRLIAETLNISRIHAGKELELEVEHFNLIDALNQILEELGDYLLSHELDIQAPDEIMIDGDRAKIISIFDNYLKNAAKYSDTGTTITIRLYETDDDMVAIEVTDQGIGIPLDSIEKIGKEAGFRTDLSKKQAGGIGLGMVYTRRVTEAHGGRMEIESTVGEGSTFRSLIPKHQSDE
ncbi:MAG: HAMP domain-containing histidine kinase [candidate division WS1 bacterium]|nr:HAMP domain-containing histidine kinase [candidate division WS1 bacterium]